MDRSLSKRVSAEEHQMPDGIIPTPVGLPVSGPLPELEVAQLPANSDETATSRPLAAPAVEVPAGEASASSNGETPAKPAYPPPPTVPTQQGPQGVRFDFNDGDRALLADVRKPWRARPSAFG